MTDTRELTIGNADLYLGHGVWRRGSLRCVDGVIVEVSPERFPRGGGRHVDARGASVLPGFQDAHVHPEHGGSGLLGIDLTAVHDADRYLDLVRAYARSHPAEAVLIGNGWYGDLFPGGMPTAAFLDRAEAERPVLLNGHDGHSLWANSAALAAASITADTPDPADGRVLRDADGIPTGVLLDGAMQLVAGLRPEKTRRTLTDGLLAAQAFLHSLGVTAWADAMVGDSELSADPFEAYLELERAGLLTGHVVLGQWWERRAGLEQIERFEQRREAVRDLPHLSAGMVKIMQDGMVENHTAAMIDPYADIDDTGASFIDPQQLVRIAAELDARGFDLHFHACGDRAVRECLDAVEALRARGGGAGRRHQIAHVDVVHPDDLPRFAKLDVTANIEMLWARRDKEMLERKLPQLGADREPWQFPFGALARAGARLAAGSDWPVSDPNPLWAIHTGMRRTAPSTDVHAIGDEARTHPLERQEGLDFTTALDAFLTGAAWVNRLDDVAGRLAPGLQGDLVVLDANLRTAPDLARVGVAETFVAGRSVHHGE